MSHWPAANASARWGVLTAIATLASVGGTSPEAMHDNAFYHGPATAGFCFELGKVSLGHFLIGLIAQSDRLPACRQFAGCAKKQDNRAGLGTAGAGRRCGGVDRFVGSWIIGRRSFHAENTEVTAV